MNVQQVLERLGEALSIADLEAEQLPVDEHLVSLPSEAVHRAVQTLLEELDIYHLSTITGQDLDDEIELLYHFWEHGGLTLRTGLPRDHARIETITDLIPGATYYEREVAEMLGVTFVGHANLQRLVLPDDWTGGPPLRHEFSWLDEREEGE